jgi:hypothetical protein
MDEPLRKFHLRTGVLDALSRHGIAYDNPIRAELEANATIAAGDAFRSRCRRCRTKWSL